MRIYLLVIIVFILLNCSGKEGKKIYEPGITYTEIQKITGDTLFLGISDIEVRGNGNIIISEAMRGVVTELSPDGSFVRRIGRQGDGPGEFRRPFMIELIRDNLYLFDNLNSRLTLYGPSGEYLSSLSTESFLSNDLYKIEDGFLNINYDQLGSGDASVYSIFDEDFNRMDVQRITLEDILKSYYQPVHKNMFFSDAMHSAKTSNNTFLITPQLYKGKIYEYTLSLPGGLSLSDSLTGLPVNELYYESDKFFDINAYNPDNQDVINVRLKSLSLGLFVLEDGKVIHFVMKDNEEVREIGVELYGADRNFLGYKPIKTDSNLYDNDRMKWSFVKDFNGKDTYYTNAVDENGEAQIVVFRLQIEE